MTFAETKEFLREIVGIYTNFKVMDGTVAAWAARLSDCTPEKARELLDRWIESDQSKYAPQLDYFVKGQKPTKISKAVWSDKPVIYHVGLRLHEVPEGVEVSRIGRGCLFDQHGREYGDPDAQGDYREDGFGRIFDCNGHLIQYMDDRGYIHNGRGVWSPQAIAQAQQEEL